MNDNEQTAFFYSLFDASLPRLAPGTNHSTLKALNILLDARDAGRGKPATGLINILDIGCGNGAQTIELAKHTQGAILAVDNHQPYLKELQRRSKAEGFSDRIQPCQTDMNALGLAESAFDLIWSEGALYIMGFQKGLAVCRSLLAPDGMLAVSELTWFRPEVPDVCRQFFDNEYPKMKDISTNLSVIKDIGYELIDHFTLTDSAWVASYYDPLENRLKSFRKKYATDKAKIEIIDAVQKEIDIYHQYSNYYGYEFFLMRAGKH